MSNANVYPDEINVLSTSACNGLLVVLVGPSGAGKNTIMDTVISRVPGLRQMPTATTRAMRSGETHGVQHYFITVPQFKQLIDDGALLEYQEVDAGKFYGVPRKEIEQTLRDRHDLLIADIDVNGAAALKAAFPDNTALIFILPPDMATLEARIRARGGVDEAEIEERIERARREMPFADKCDYQVVNRELEQATAEVIDIVRAEATKHGCL